MSKSKLAILLIVVLSFFGGVLLVSFSPGVETFAQRVLRNSTQFENNWQYCVITRIRTENPPQDRLDKFTGSVFINYFVYSYDRIALKESYVQTECIKHELSYAEFLQENNLKNNLQAQQMASSRAADLALAKAMNKLGTTGWEMVGRSFANVSFETLDGNSEYKNSLYFRKHLAQRQLNAQQ